MDNLTTNEKIFIIENVKNIPPYKWLKLCETLDQAYHWQELKCIFTKIHNHLQTYFSGNNLEYHSDDDLEEKVYKLMSRKFIDLYNVIYYEYHELQEYAEKYKLKIPLKPGEYLVACIVEEANLKFQQCQTYHEFRPKSLSKTHYETRKYHALKLKKDKTKAEERRITMYEIMGLRMYEIRKIQTPLQFLALQIGSRSKNEEVKISMRNFNGTCDRLTHLLHSEVLHPSKGYTNVTWNRGIRTP